MGGVKVSTSRSTLLSAGHGTLLYTMFSGEHAMLPDEDDGSFFIDRDGRHFYHILNFLRMPAEFQMPSDGVVASELLKEAAYYKLVGGCAPWPPVVHRVAPCNAAVRLRRWPMD